MARSGYAVRHLSSVSHRWRSRAKEAASDRAGSAITDSPGGVGLVSSSDLTEPGLARAHAAAAVVVYPPAAALTRPRSRARTRSRMSSAASSIVYPSSCTPPARSRAAQRRAASARASIAAGSSARTANDVVHADSSSGHDNGGSPGPNPRNDRTCTSATTALPSGTERYRAGVGGAP